MVRIVRRNATGHRIYLRIPSAETPRWTPHPADAVDFDKQPAAEFIAAQLRAKGLTGVALAEAPKSEASPAAAPKSAPKPRSSTRRPPTQAAPRPSTPPRPAPRPQTTPKPAAPEPSTPSPPAPAQAKAASSAKPRDGKWF